MINSEEPLVLVDCKLGCEILWEQLTIRMDTSQKGALIKNGYIARDKNGYIAGDSKISI